MASYPTSANELQRQLDLVRLLDSLQHAHAQVGTRQQLVTIWRDPNPVQREVALSLEAAFVGTMNHLAEITVTTLIHFNRRVEKDQKPRAFVDAANEGIVASNVGQDLRDAHRMRNKLGHERQAVSPKQVWVAVEKALTNAAAYKQSLDAWVAVQT